MKLKNNIKKIAFIGFGSIATKHISIIEDFYPDIEICIVTKRNLNKKYKTYKNISSLKKKNIDAVFITSPANEHYKALKILYTEDLNFFIEKPIFHKNYDMSKIEKYLKNNNHLICQIGYVFRHDDIFHKFKYLLSQNYLGKIENIKIYCGSDLSKWRSQKNLKHSISLNKLKGGGVLLELSHEIDYCLWLFGKIKFIKADLINSGKFLSKVEDMANILMINDKKQEINMHLNFCQDKSERFCMVTGKKGVIKIDLINRFIKVNTEKLSKKIIFKSQLNEIYKKQIDIFFNSIYLKKKSSVPVSEGLKVLDIIEKAKISHKSNKIITV